MNIPRRKKGALPTQTELAKAFANARPQVRAEMAIVALAGQRIEVLGMRESDDGLRFSDFPEASFDKDGNLQFAREPTIISVRKEISKMREPYIAFLGSQGCKFLQQYVELRQKRGEVVTLNSPVIVAEVQGGVSRRRGASTDPTLSKQGRVEFVHPNNIGDSIRAVFRNQAVGIQKNTGRKDPKTERDIWEGITPYNLRHYFSQRAGLAQKEGLDNDYKEFWMGHKAKVSQRYSMYGADKGLIEEMRTAYGLALKYIETSEQTRRNAPARREVLEMILSVSGKYTEDQLRAMTEEQVITEGTALMKTVQAEPVKTPEPVQVATEDKQRIVSKVEAKTMLAQGWRITSVFPDGDVVVERTG
jgi:integrase